MRDKKKKKNGLEPYLRSIVISTSLYRTRLTGCGHTTKQGEDRYVEKKLESERETEEKKNWSPKKEKRQQ